MKMYSRIAFVGLLVLIAGVLISNVRYLYTSPVANSFNWWQGDETWLMAQSNHFVTTGHYTNPLAPGSAYSESSGMLFGSCYATAAIYGLPSLLIKVHSIDTGRTISWIFALMTLLAFWMIARRYNTAPVLCAFGCLIMVGTVCFFITSHCARSDMLVGLAILILSGLLPLLVEKPFVNSDVFLGMLLPFSLLINGHVLIISFLMIGYVAWASGVLGSKRSIVRLVGAAFTGFTLLLIVQEVLLGSGSLMGPFSGSSGRMPIMRLFHPKADLANLDWRLFIANAWAPGLIWLSILLASALVWARFRHKIRLSKMEPAARRTVICSALVILPSIFLEYYEPRYFIYVLPTIVLSLLIIISYLFQTLPRSSLIALTAGLSVCLVFTLWRYKIDTIILGEGGEKITAANNTAVREALATIHSHCTDMPRIYSTVTGEAVTMDDSCTLITPIMYYQPLDSHASREDLWNHANIKYAIVCNPAHSLDWNETDSCISWSDRSHGTVIFERVGIFSDIGRSYNPSDLSLLDTLRVYEFQ
jgi:hypothetical protein